jgi:peptidoglycan hydrolase-like protein with peptidoglycan-binding domain
MTMVNPISAANSDAESASISARDAVLYEGDSGSAVVELQQLLNTKGFRLIVDGNFGPATKAAVLKFQRQNTLLADGIVGPTTWAALRKAIASIQLIDVCENYDPLTQPHQTAALEWLQSQIPAATLNAFARRWRNTSLP